MGVRAHSPRRSLAVMYVLDAMHIDGTWLLDEPYQSRRERLEELKFQSPGWVVPPTIRGRGREILAVSKAFGV